VELIRRTDQNHVEFGVEGADAINKPISDLMFQSDMMLNLKQVDELAENTTQKRSKRQAQTGPSFPVSFLQYTYKIKQVLKKDQFNVIFSTINGQSEHPFLSTLTRP
jgi:hypothetical protein